MVIIDYQEGLSGNGEGKGGVGAVAVDHQCEGARGGAFQPGVLKPGVVKAISEGAREGVAKVQAPRVDHRACPVVDVESPGQDGEAVDEGPTSQPNSNLALIIVHLVADDLLGTNTCLHLRRPSYLGFDQEVLPEEDLMTKFSGGQTKLTQGSPQEPAGHSGA